MTTTAAATNGAGGVRMVELDTVASRWEAALDSAQRAVNDAGGPFGLPATELEHRRRELVHERQRVADALRLLARETGVPAPWLAPAPITPRMLGLDARVSACVFDLDGVLTDSAVLHASAWAEVFDAFLLKIAQQAGWHFRRFDTRADYRTYVEGRPRLEGIHAFLDSRGIRLPEGRPADPSSVDTAYGLSQRKAEALSRILSRRRVAALPAARRYLEACGYAGLERAVLSASASTSAMLELAGLGALVEVRIDAEVIRAEQLRSRPAPDLVLSAARRLAIAPDGVVSFTHTPAGVVAAHAAGASVIAVADGSDAELLRHYGAERVVPSLETLLEGGAAPPGEDGARDRFARAPGGGTG